MDDDVANPGGAEAPDLGAADRFLVWATRRYAFRCGTAVLIDREFRRLCGDPLGAEAGAAFRAFLRILACHARRPLALGPPGGRDATPDEQSLLALFAAAQARSEDRMRMHLAWLMPGEPARMAWPCVAFVAAVLRDHARCLGPVGPRLRAITPLDEPRRPDIVGKLRMVRIRMVLIKSGEDDEEST